ncbi:MAG: polyprenol monophosphomannose synthase [Planctomycetota bacterium]|nr:polyprenol monophosphomannose synthase [Planctomycetota bacterium]
MTGTLITLCTFNERENIVELIPELHAVAPDATILIIDDNSPDGTGQLADQLSAADPRVQVLHRAGKQGLGTAILAGFRYAIGHNFAFVVNLDADFSHPPKYIPELTALMSQCDVAIASRYVDGGGVAGWTRWRKLMSQSINLWAKLCMGLRTKDNSGSFRCYRVSKLAEIDWKLTMARGYAFQEEVLYRCQRIGCRMSEFPFVFEDRRFGTTKINFRECIAAGWVIFALGIQRLFGCRVKTQD